MGIGSAVVTTPGGSRPFNDDEPQGGAEAPPCGVIVQRGLS